MNTSHLAAEENSLSRRQFVSALATAGALWPLAAVAGNIPVVPARIDRPLCIFSKHLHWLAVPEMAQTAAELGFTGVDLTVRKGGHIEPERAATDLPRAVAQIRRAGLEVPLITTDIIDAQHPLTESVLKAARQAGVKQYRTGWLEYNPALGVTKNLENYRQQLRELAALNQKYTIQGAYQNHAGTSVGAAVWDLWELLKDLDPRWLGVQYDIKHATAEGGFSWVNGLKLLRNHISSLDIKDFYWAKQAGKWQHQLVPLGEGMVDFKKYFGLIKQYNLTGPVSLHLEYPLGGAESGEKQITVPKDEVLNAMKRDLQTLRGMMQEAGLG